MNPDTLHKHPYGAFLGLALLLFPLTLVAAGLLLQSWEHLAFFSMAFTANPRGLLVEAALGVYFLLPFVLLGAMCASLSQRLGSCAGLLLLAVGAVFLGLTHLCGFHDSLAAREQQAWTAMTLSTGLLPFFSLPALVICACVRWCLLGRSGVRR